MKKIMIVMIILVLFFSLPISRLPVEAEEWCYFATLIDESDYFAQYQIIKRDNKVIGRRLVKVYWKDENFRESLIAHYSNKPFSLKQFDREKDKLITNFVFYGRGQSLGDISQENGIILYPGETAHRRIGSEIACSSIEFHEILLEAGKLKKEGKKIEGNLTLTVFGKKDKAKIVILKNKRPR